MRVTSLPRAILVAMGAFAASALLLWGLKRFGVWLPPTNALVVFVEVTLAAVVLLMGWRVRRYLAGKNPGLKPLPAARAFIMAKAGSYCGALLVGWYSAWLLEGLMQEVDRQERLLGAGLAIGGGLVLLAAGMIVERWCRIPPPEEEEDEPEGIPDGGPA